VGFSADLEHPLPPILRGEVWKVGKGVSRQKIPTGSSEFRAAKRSDSP